MYDGLTVMGQNSSACYTGFFTDLTLFPYVTGLAVLLFFLNRPFTGLWFLEFPILHGNCKYGEVSCHGQVIRH